MASMTGCGCIHQLPIFYKLDVDETSHRTPPAVIPYHSCGGVYGQVLGAYPRPCVQILHVQLGGLACQDARQSCYLHPISKLPQAIPFVKSAGLC